ncbi:uncharacterized [Tachysurus ichikawai]
MSMKSIFRANKFFLQSKGSVNWKGLDGAQDSERLRPNFSSTSSNPPLYRGQGWVLITTGGYDTQFKYV